MDPHGYMTEEQLNTLIGLMAGQSSSLPAAYPMTRAVGFNHLDLIRSCGQCKYMQTDHRAGGNNFTCLKGMCPITPRPDMHNDDFWPLIHAHSELCAGYAIDDDYDGRPHAPIAPPKFSLKRYRQLQETIARIAIKGVLSPKYQIPIAWQNAYDDYVRNHPDVGSETDPVHSDDGTVHHEV